MDAKLASNDDIQENRFETPELISPPISKTPPTVERQAPPNDAGPDFARSSTPVDAAELSKKLQHHEDSSGRQREHTPGASPSRKRPRTFYGGDRYVSLQALLPNQ